MNYTDEYINPYITCCTQNSPYAGVSSYENFLRSCFNNLKNCYNENGGYTGNWADVVYHRYGRDCSAKWTNEYKDLISPIVQDVQANADAASAAEASSINDAIQARKAGINAGMGKARAGLLGDATSNTNTSNVYNNAYGASIQNQGSTQADYLQKMGQVTDAECQAKNMQSGAALNTAGATLQGAGSGASLGASIGSGGK
jgi:hypothetical protein